MKDALIDKTPHPDDIDALVEDLLRNPERAEAVKASLRDKMGSGEVVELRAPKAPPAAIEADDVDDFWENVPI